MKVVKQNHLILAFFYTPLNIVSTIEFEYVNTYERRTDTSSRLINYQDII